MKTQNRNGGRYKKSTLERFTEKIEINPTTGCWLWNGSLQNASRQPPGLARGCMFDPWMDSTQAAHHVAWRLAGEGKLKVKHPEQFVDPEGKFIAHTCQNGADDKPTKRSPRGYRPCVNPEHLQLTDKPTAPRGARHPKAKLTEEIVRELRRAWKPSSERVTYERLATERINGRPAPNVSREAARRVVLGFSSGGVDGRGKINPKHVARMRRDYEPPVILQDLLEDLAPGVEISKSALASAAAGRTWKHVDAEEQGDD